MSQHEDTAPNHDGPAAATLPLPKREPRVQQPRLWNVVLLNDEDHSYEYVVDMMKRVFSAPFERAYAVAKAVDTQGRAVCGTFHKELAELKLDQIISCGRDARIASCKGPMSAHLEPADAPEGE